MAKPTVAPTTSTKDKCGAIVLDCDCKDDFQDKLYGKNKRVHTKKVKANRCSGHTCCSCGKTKNKQYDTYVANNSSNPCIHNLFMDSI